MFPKKRSGPVHFGLVKSSTLFFTFKSFWVISDWFFRYDFWKNLLSGRNVCISHIKDRNFPFTLSHPDFIH